MQRKNGYKKSSSFLNQIILKDLSDDEDKEDNEDTESKSEEDDEEDEEDEEGGKRFKYKTDGDLKGIIYYIATNYGKSKDYSNPHNSGKVTCTASSSLGTGNISEFVDKGTLSAWVSGSNSTSLTFDFKKSSLKVDKYTLKTFNQTCCYPRGWNLEGSNDGKKFTVIQKYQDSSINSSGASKMFVVKKCSKYFKQLRITLTVQSSSNWNWGTQVEFYGKFKK